MPKWLLTINTFISSNKKKYIEEKLNDIFNDNSK